MSESDQIQVAPRKSIKPSVEEKLSDVKDSSFEYMGKYVSRIVSFSYGQSTFLTYVLKDAY